jgi:outer membrane protein OmpA-like peptidoglycan-associated protein/Tol biopolymer transport system component
MKRIVYLFLIISSFSSAQMTDQQIRAMIRIATEPELIIESSSLIIEKKLYQAQIIVDKLLELNPTSANYNYRKGFLLLNSNLDYKNAIIYFEKALPQADKDYDLFSITDTTCSNDIYYHLANCFHLDGQIKKAKEFYTIVSNFNDKNTDIVKKSLLNTKQCNIALKLLENPKKSTINNIGSSINTEFPEYSPVISLDGQALYFTSRRSWENRETEKYRDLLLHNYPEDIYVSYKENSKETKWSSPTKLAFCEAERNEATIALSPDERRIFVYQDNVGKGDIFYSDLKSNSFDQVKQLETKDVNTKYWETHITATIDGLNMYFVSDRPGGFGGRDIYRITKLPNGAWSEPKNLGPNINSAYDEDSPFIGADNKTLYFSSNGEQSMGGFDIFLSVRDEDNNWSQAINLGYPINSFSDDIFYTTTIDGTRGYFSSYREDGQGEKDIYEIKNDELGLKNIAALKGVIKSAYNKSYPGNILISLKCIDCGDTVSKIVYPRDRDGSFFQSLETCKNYKASFLTDNGTKEFFEESFTTSCDAEYDEIYREFLLDSDNMRFIQLQDTVGLSYEEFKTIENQKIQVMLSNKEIVKVDMGSDLGALIAINPIYYDFNKSNIRENAANELDKIIKILNDNPKMSIELGSHTDCRGKKEYNLKLSSSRAKSSVNYIKKRIVNPKRISGKGYGETKLKNNCSCEGEIGPTCSEEEHQLNRRTEFIIVKTK